MLITDIKVQSRDKSRVSVYIDNKFAFGMSEADRLFYKLEKGKEITQEKYDEIINENIYSKAKDKAAKFLSYRMRSEKELRDKLREDFGEEVTKKVIELFKRYGYINDTEFALAFAKDCINIKKWGGLRIRRELRLKGVSDSDVDTALASLENTEDTYNTIKALLDRRIKNKPMDIKEKQKQFNYLLGRGFRPDDIKEVLNKYFI